MEPLPCPAGMFCPTSLLQAACRAGLRCEENSTRPGLCRDGFYCPDGFEISCPKGSFCPLGSTGPTQCARLASCPEGSSRQDFSSISHAALAFAVVVWATAITSVPRWLHPQGGLSGAVPTVVTLAVLCGAWLFKLDVIYTTVKTVSTSSDPKQLRTDALFGGAPHASPLMFLTMSYSGLLYGLLVSVWIRRPLIRLLVDSIVGAIMCAAFNAYLKDPYVLVFMVNLFVAFKILWSVISQQGTLAWRLGLFAAGQTAVVGGFFLLRAPELAHLYLLGLFAIGAKVLLRSASSESCRSLQRLLRSLGERRAGALCDTPLRPLIGPLTQTRDDAYEDVLASDAVAAAARASLSLVKASWLETGALKSAANAEAWAMWCQPEASSLDSMDLEPGPEHSSDDGRRPVGGRTAATHGVEFELQGLSLHVEDGRELLRDISFRVPGGAMVAIMGASGAGKSTLLSVLSGRCAGDKLQGQFLLDGTRRRPWQMAEMRPLIGFVPQDDVVQGLLSVRENIEFQAELRLPRNNIVRRTNGQASCVCREEAPRELKERIEAVISGMSLSHVQDRLVQNGLSGGQRKRVSIGMEVVAKPRMLMLDEPSSGLDSSSAHRILDAVLRGAREECCTTFATIHQPRWNTLNLFDMLVLLCPGGYLCFAGPVTVIRCYFREALNLEFPADENPSDVMVDACTFESARKMALEGVWRDPPQCLRAVLFPTPGALDDECATSWQQDEYGRTLAMLWRDFSEARLKHIYGSAAEASSDSSCAPHSPTSPLSSLSMSRSTRWMSQVWETEIHDSLAAEVRERGRAIHWAQQIWMHVARCLLLTSRAVFPSIFLNMLCLMASVRTLGWLFFARQEDPGQIFLQNAVLLLLISLGQSVAAQRIFGGDERKIAWREASVSSLSQVLYSFIGKDTASLVEIAFSAVCCALLYLPTSNSFASGGDLFSIFFAFQYAVWGLNHMLAIAMPTNSAMLLGVIGSFLSFSFSGLMPPAHVLTETLWGYGSMLVLASPHRWALASIVFRHVTGRGATFTGEMRNHLGGYFIGQGFDLGKLQCPNYSVGAMARINDHQGWVCHNGQLFLLGFLFRFLALFILMLSGMSKSSGGQLALGVHSSSRSQLLRDGIGVFIIGLAVLNIWLLGFMH